MARQFEFHEGYKVNPETGCWEWFRAKNSAGYGLKWFRGRLWKAHRISWVLAGNDLSDDELLRHSCDNPPCVNPAHLSTGRQADNILDMIERGRSCSDLSRGAVVAIRTLRASGARCTDIADHFGISRHLVSLICTGKTRVHDGGPRTTGRSYDRNPDRSFSQILLANGGQR